MGSKSSLILPLEGDLLFTSAIMQQEARLIAPLKSRGGGRSPTAPFNRSIDFTCFRWATSLLLLSRILSRIISQEADIAKKRGLLKELGHEVLELTYDELVGKEGNEVDRLPDLTAEKICTFLGVRYEHLCVDLRRVNRAPLSEMIDNWGDVKKHIGATKYKQWLKEEE